MVSDTTAALTRYARHIRETVYRWTGLPVSIGIGPSKTLAKAANERAKKTATYRGVYAVIGTSEARILLERLPVEELWGIAHGLGRRLHRYGITTAWQLREADLRWVKQKLHLSGLRTAWELRGKPCCRLEDAPASSAARKSILTSRSFGEPVSDLSMIEEAISTYMSIAARKLRRHQRAATVVHVFLQTSRFKSDDYHRCASVTLPFPAMHTPELLHPARQLVRRLFRRGRRYKKAGVILLGLQPAAHMQTPLFATYGDRRRHARLTRTIDRLNDRMGRYTVRYAAAVQPVHPKPWQMKSAQRSPCFTTRWEALPCVHAR